MVGGALVDVVGLKLDNYFLLSQGYWGALFDNLRSSLRRNLKYLGLFSRLVSRGFGILVGRISSELKIVAFVALYGADRAVVALHGARVGHLLLKGVCDSNVRAQG